MIARAFFDLSRSALAGPLVRFGFRWVWWLIPVRRVASTGHVLAFRHPRPSWETHILIVPKTGVAGLMWVHERELRAFTDMLATARDLAARLHEEESEPVVTFLINGGEWQDVGQMHGHLAAGSDAPMFRSPNEEPAERPDDIRVRMHPLPERPFHALIELPAGVMSEATAGELIRAVHPLVREHIPHGQGFALFTDLSRGENVLRTFHLVSGRAK